MNLQDLTMMDDLIDQGGFAMVNMGDDGNIPQILSPLVHIPTPNLNKILVPVGCRLPANRRKGN